MRFFPTRRLAAAVTCLLIVFTTANCTGHTEGSASYAGGGLPRGVTLREIDGGPDYFADISHKSVWMDDHILLGAWLEQPLNAAEVAYDHATGDNIYWNLAGFGHICNGIACVASFKAIRNGGMHVSAPGVAGDSGSESVAYEGTDQADLEYGPGWDAWNKADNKCIPADGRCGYTVARWYFTDQPSYLGTPDYQTQGAVIEQGYG